MPSKSSLKKSKPSSLILPSRRCLSFSIKATANGESVSSLVPANCDEDEFEGEVREPPTPTAVADPVTAVAEGGNVAVELRSFVFR